MRRRRATREQLARVHGARLHRRRIEAASPTSGLRYLDPDTALNPHSLEAALHAAGAVVNAVDLVCGGERANGVLRGASARPSRGARAARWASACSTTSPSAPRMRWRSHGLSRVAIVDFDVHHGNGTEEMFSDDPRVLMVSTFQYPLYPYSGVDNPAPNMVNVPLAAGAGSAEFRDAVVDHWLPALERHQPQLILISAGFDAHREDPLAGLQFTEADYAWVTRELIAVAQRHAQGRIVSSLEGGYALSALGRSAAEHVRELMMA